VRTGPAFEPPSSAILLDTHTLLWLVSAPDQLSANAREAISDPVREIAVSAASAWEIAIKTRLGRLDGEPLLAAWPDIMAAMAVTELPIEVPDAMWPHHRHPRRGHSQCSVDAHLDGVTGRSR
jgi:PIN domain nuclease of toxin-antitoxin system